MVRATATTIRVGGPNAYERVKSRLGADIQHSTTIRSMLISGGGTILSIVFSIRGGGEWASN